MSKRTFIPIWRPHPHVQSVLSRGPRCGLRRRSDFIRRKSCTNKGRAGVQVDEGEVQWYGNNLLTKVASQIAHGRITQRVGLFHNAKNSHVVVNDISSAVRKTSNKQIGRLVAPDEVATFPGNAYNAGSPTLESFQKGSLYLNKDQSYQLVGKSSVTDKYLKRADLSYGPAINCEKSEYIADNHNRLNHKSSESTTEDNYDPNEYGSSFHDIEMEPIRKRFCRSVGNLAARQQERMHTPSDQTTHTFPCALKDEFTLSGVATRILSALPPIYLRDDHHDKYDTVAIRLLNESLKQSESIPGASSSLYRSFLDRTGGIFAEKNTHSEHDNACENIFQNDLFDNENASTAQVVTPEIEKIFNRTVLENNPDEHPEYTMYNLRSRKHAVNGEQMSFLMTPSSVDSPQFQPSASSSHSKHISFVKHGSVFCREYDFERSSSSSGSSSKSEGCVDVASPHFEWTLPVADGGVYDVINGSRNTFKRDI